MGKFDGVLLAADYDDTYYDRTFTISTENRRAVERFMAQGGRFVVATGRSYINFAIQMEVEKPPLNGPVILSNGASIHDFSKGQTLWEQHLLESAPALLRRSAPPSRSWALRPTTGIRCTPTGPTRSPTGT